MAKFNVGDKVNLLSYEWLVETGVVREYGDSVHGIAKSDYEQAYARNPHTVYCADNISAQFSPTSFSYSLDCLELAEPKLTIPEAPKFGFPMTVDILGTKYDVILVDKFDDDESNFIGGFTDPDLHLIKIRDLEKIDAWKKETAEKIEIRQKETLRHEIVHAYLDESGLKWCTLDTGDSWASNEEMVDWFAIQGPKIMETWRKAGCL